MRFDKAIGSCFRYRAAGWKKKHNSAWLPSLLDDQLAHSAQTPGYG